jgi:hypothetical protein
MGEMMWEEVGEFPWIVAFSEKPPVITYSPAPPEWASPQLAETVLGRTAAALRGVCIHCRMRTPPDWIVEGVAVLGSPHVRHVQGCPWSWKTVERLAGACAPPGTRWIADMSEEAADRLNEYIVTLAERLRQFTGEQESHG